MAKYSLIVITDPAAGKEAEYNRWYDQQHVKDVLAVPGFVAARRFRVVDEENALPGRYVAIYEIDSDDPQAVLAELNARAGTAALQLSDALDLASAKIALCEPIGHPR